VLSISISLVAVFIPLLFMGGQVGRLFREFAVTLSAAVLISLVISLTTTPMMCAYHAARRPEGFKERPASPAPVRDGPSPGSQDLFELVPGLGAGRQAGGDRDPGRDHRPDRLPLHRVPKGFFPQQDNGQLMAGIRADQSVSFQAMEAKLRAVVDIIRKDPAVDTVVGFTGGARAGGGFMFVNLKPLGEREKRRGGHRPAAAPSLQKVTGVSVFLNPVQDLRMGGRSSQFDLPIHPDSATPAPI
jgi:multidrug efflux pump